MGKNRNKSKGSQKRKRNNWSDCKGTRAHFAPKFWRYCLLATNLPENFDENRLKQFILDKDGKGFIIQKKMRSNWNERVAQFQFKMRLGREKAILRLSGIQWEGKKIYLERVGDIFDNLKPRPRTVEGYGIVITFENPSTLDGLPLKNALKSKGICFRKGLKAVHNSLLILPDKAYLAFETEADQEKAIHLVNELKYVAGLGFLRAHKQAEKFRETFVSYVEDDWDDISREPLEREGEEGRGEARGDIEGEEEESEDRDGDQGEDADVADQCSAASEENQSRADEICEENAAAQGSVYSSTVPATQASSSVSYASEGAEIGPFCICIANLPENTNVDQIKLWCKKTTKVNPKKKSKFINNILQLRYDPASDREKAFRVLRGASWKGKKLIVEITDDVLQYHKHALKFDGYPIEITNFGRECILQPTRLKELLMREGIYDLSVIGKMPVFRKESAFVSFRTSEDQEIAIRRLDGLKCQLGHPTLDVTKAESEYADDRPQAQAQGQGQGQSQNPTMHPQPVQQRYPQPAPFQQAYGGNQNSQRFSQNRGCGNQGFQQFSGNQGFQQFSGNRDNFQQYSGDMDDFQQSRGNLDDFRQSRGNWDESRQLNRNNFQQFSGNRDNFQQSSGNRDYFQQCGNQDYSHRYGMGNEPPNTYHQTTGNRGNQRNFHQNNDHSKGQEGGYGAGDRNYGNSYRDDRDNDNRKRVRPDGYGDYREAPKRGRGGQFQYGGAERGYESRY